VGKEATGWFFFLLVYKATISMELTYIMMIVKND